MFSRYICFVIPIVYKKNYRFEPISKLITKLSSLVLGSPFLEIIGFDFASDTELNDTILGSRMPKFNQCLNVGMRCCFAQLLLAVVAVVVGVVAAVVAVVAAVVKAEDVVVVVADTSHSCW